MWNASHVQKHFSWTWQEWFADWEWETVRGNLSTSLLEGFTCSDAAQSDCKNRTVVWKLLEKRHAGSWLSRLPLTKNWKIAGTFSQEHCSVFVGRWLQCSPAPPCWIGKSSSWLKKRVSRNETAKPSLRSFTSFQMIHTHTHLCAHVSHVYIYICVCNRAMVFHDEVWKTSSLQPPPFPWPLRLHRSLWAWVLPYQRNLEL